MLVLGAGPAGSAAALRGARHGLRVAVIERARFPRDLPGENLHPDIEALFDELGAREALANAGFLRNPGWMLEQGEQSTYIPYGAPHELRFGYQAWRAKLDAMLLELARAAGVEVLEETDAQALLMQDGRVTGIEVAGRTLTAAHVIDATGPHSWLSRKLSIAAEPLSPRLVARYGYSDRDMGVGALPRYREYPDGWTWLARVRDQRWQYVQLSLVPGRDLPPPPAAWGFPDRLRGADVSWRLVRECAGPGYFLCGDAAATIDPGASRGVARALQSGIRAADLAAAVRNGERSGHDAAQAYKTWLAEAIVSEAGRLAERYAQWERAPAWVRRFNERHAVAEAV
jgi:flavin-dependent dehydrogenase